MLCPMPKGHVQGWAADEPRTHDEFSEGWTPERVWGVLSNEGELDKGHILYDSLQSYMSAHTQTLLEDAISRQISPQLLRPILCLRDIAISEDDLLRSLLRHALQLTGVLAQSPTQWTAEERALVHPLIVDLIPLIRIQSLSTKAVLTLLEPLEIVSEREICAKYKYDALFAQIQSFPLNIELYADGSEKKERIEIQKRRRGTLCMAESSHPYEAGEDEAIDRVSVSSWAERTYVEFDRACDITEGAHLTFYRDPDASNIIATWSQLWGSGRRKKGIKALVIDSNIFYVGFKTSIESKPAWGWRLLATPVHPPVASMAES